MFLTMFVIFLYLLALVFGSISGNMSAVTMAINDGTSSAVSLCITLLAVISFWSGIMNIANKAGLTGKISILFNPLLKILFPKIYKDKEIMGLIASNMSANLLGISNAATPIGLKAGKLICDRYGTSGKAPNELITLIVMNTASIQLIPTTVATIRAGAGAISPFDIMPAAIISSGVAFFVAIICSKIFAR